MPRHDSVLLLKLVVKLANAPSHIQATSARASASASSRRSEASWASQLGEASGSCRSISQFDAGSSICGGAHFPREQQFLGWW